MNSKYLFWFFLLFVCGQGFSQNKMDSLSKKNYPNLKDLFSLGYIDLESSRNVYKDKFTSIFKKEDAFFCRIERRIDKKTKINSRFRLGDLSTVNRLEGK